MSKKIVVITGSPRRNGNSFAMTDAFMKAAEAKGHTITRFDAALKQIGGCRACETCFSTGKACTFDDDFNTIAPAILEADVIVFATPVYYYEMSGQMKTMLDRGNSLYTSDYAFRDIYLLSSAAEDEEGVDERAIHGLEGWIACYPKAHLAGVVFAGGVSEAGEIDGHPSLKKAYDMGLAIK